MTKPKIYTVAELSKMWNGVADEHNQWATLGIDEIIEFAQQACAANALEFDEPASMSEEPVAWRTEGVHPGAYRFTDIGLQAEAWEKQGKAVEPLYTNAAAPELLEALHHIEGLALAEESRDLPTIAQAARAAISKATAPWA